MPSVLFFVCLFFFVHFLYVELSEIAAGIFGFSYYFCFFASTLKMTNFKFNLLVLCFSAYFKVSKSFKKFQKFLVNAKNEKKLKTVFSKKKKTLKTKYQNTKYQTPNTKYQPEN